MASDDSDYGWDTDLDEDVHALLSAVAESTAAAIDQSVTTAVAVPVLEPQAVLASAPPTLVAAPSNALRNDVLSQSLQDGGGDEDEVEDGDVNDVNDVDGNGDEKTNLDRDINTTRIQDVQNPLSPSHTRLVASSSPQVAYPDLSRALGGLNDAQAGVSGSNAGQPVINIESSGSVQGTLEVVGRQKEKEKENENDSTLSPLARFRTFPRKPLSVSDLTSGAWCEVQYEYTLTRLPGGRRTRTAAMKGGTKVHTRLEEEVHTTVRVDVSTREDFLGIKLWNMIQGLRTLRETGLTRELEIWGVIPGTGSSDGKSESESDGPQVVNGIIDALSYHNPDPAFEELLESTGQHTAVTTTPAPAPENQRTPRKRGRPESSTTTPTTSPQKAKITDFYASQAWPRSPAAAAAGPSTEQPPPPLPPAPQPTPPQPPPRRVYITDIKTRGTDRLPSGMAVRPTKVQLFLYHRFLSDLAAGRLDFNVVFNRYRLNKNTPFSDSFMAQIGAVHEEVFYDAENETYEIREVADTADESVRYGTLQSLVALLQEEVAQTFPRGADSIGSIVAVEYRMRSRESREDDGEDPEAGRCIGTNVIPVDEGLLDRYLSWYMAWWRGQRPAVGVQVEEAGYKCRLCEFADDCEWRIAKAEEHVQRVRERREEQRR